MRGKGVAILKKYEWVAGDHGQLIKVEIKKPKTEPSEADIQKKIADIFVRDGWEVVRFNSGMVQDDGRYIAFSRNINSGLTSGIPDLEISKNLRSVRIEVKKPKGKHSKNQILYAENALKHRNPIMVMRSPESAYRFLELLKTVGIETAAYSFSNDIIK